MRQQLMKSPLHLIKKKNQLWNCVTYNWGFWLAVLLEANDPNDCRHILRHTLMGKLSDEALDRTSVA